MQITRFKIKDRTIYQISNYKLIGIVGQDKFGVAFQDNEWDGLHKTMKIIRSDGKIVKLALVDDEVELTQECYIPGISKVGFYGTINEDDPEELKIASTDYAQITFLEHAYDNEDGVAITDPTPSQYDILIGRILDTKDEVDALKVELEDEIAEIERKVRDGEFDGEDGVGISNIVKISTVGLVNTYQINYTDGNSTTFEVTNGEKGDDGVSVVSVIKTSGTSAPGTTDIYTITLSNGNTFNFSVYNGKDGYDDTEIRQELAGKQDALTAGAGISISNNVISVSEGFSVVVVAELPTAGEPNTLYLVPTGDPSPNYCNEYIYVDNIGWEQVGTTQIDLSNYYTKSETNALLGDKVNKNGDTMTGNLNTTGFSAGLGLTSVGSHQVVSGHYNIPDISVQTGSGNNLAEIVGNGGSDSAKSNAYTLDWNGNAWFAGDVYVGSTSGTNKDAGSIKLVKEQPGIFFVEISELFAIDFNSSKTLSQTDAAKLLDLVNYKIQNPERAVVLFLRNTTTSYTSSDPVATLILSTNNKYKSTHSSIELCNIYNCSLQRNPNRSDKFYLNIQFNVVNGVVTSINSATLNRTERVELEKTSNKTTTISANSTDTEYPSALAVKNYVDSQISGAIGGAY